MQVFAIHVPVVKFTIISFKHFKHLGVPLIILHARQLAFIVEQLVHVPVDVLYYAGVQFVHNESSNLNPTLQLKHLVTVTEPL